jgi:hypothetical protein
MLVRAFRGVLHLLRAWHAGPLRATDGGTTLHNGPVDLALRSMIARSHGLASAVPGAMGSAVDAAIAMSVGPRHDSSLRGDAFGLICAASSPSRLPHPTPWTRGVSVLQAFTPRHLDARTFEHLGPRPPRPLP